MATAIPRTKWGSKQKQLRQEPGVIGGGLSVTLAYEGKKPDADILATEPAGLVSVWSGQREAKNRLLYGDNLGIMAALLPTLAGKVKLVYIDPPFATKGVFQTRSQTDAYQDILAGSHYVEFIRERLIILRDLLADDGSIYVHLDENMAFYIKVIMDEVFGASSFRNWITRRKCNPKNYTRNTYGSISDYILFYTKTANYIWNRPYDKWTPERAAKEYQYVEPVTGRLYKKVPVHAPGVRNGETGKPWRDVLPPVGKHWQYPPRVLDEMDGRGEIYWSPNGNPRRKIYLDESEGVAIQDIWTDVRDAHNQNIRITGYPTEKNPALLDRIVRASSNPGDLVFDCFSGSGTTLAVASELGRNWVGIDSSQVAITASFRRLLHGRERMGDFVNERKLQYPLFPVDDPGNLPRLIDDTHVPVRDFQLLAVQGHEHDLSAMIAEVDTPRAK